MLGRIDDLLERDGAAAKAAGLLALAILGALSYGAIPAEHTEAAVAVATMLATFAPAAMRRHVSAKRKAISDDQGDS